MDWQQPKQRRRSSLFFFALLTLSAQAHAGGPRWVQGVGAYHNAGQAIVWGNGGAVSYYTDLGSLSSTVSNSAANALVAAAFAPWNAVQFSSASLTNAGSLNEDVNSTNVYIDSSSGTPVIAWPTDAAAGYTAKPLAIIYDEDGSIIDLLLGTGASSPLACNQNAVIEDVDNVSYSGIIQHARLILNGRCATSSLALQQMQYELERKAGRVLGLDWSQANDDVFTGSPTPTYLEEEYWPVMHPIDILCGPYTFQCMVNPFTLRDDDAAALGRLYTISSASQAAALNKSNFYNTVVFLTGTLAFPNGQGMQGVNVIVREALQSSGSPYPYVMASGVTGYEYTGNRGNPVTGYVATDGSTLPEYGSTSASLEGYFNLSGYIPAAVSGPYWDWADVSFEPLNPLYVGQYSVGPYTVDPVMPAGTMPASLNYPFSHAGSSITMGTVTISTAPNDTSMGAGGTWSAPSPVTVNGWWDARLGSPATTAWYSLPVQANRIFTVEVTALDENGNVSEEKMMPVIGIWNYTEAQGVTPDLGTTAFDAISPAMTSLTAQTTSAEEMRIAITDQRGDGRPDYNYRARVLYAASVSPQLVSTTGGTLVINGMGFRQGNQVLINGVTAAVQYVSDTQMVVTAPAMSALTGVSAGQALTLEISDATTGGTTQIINGLTYVASTTSSSGSEQLNVLSGGTQQILQTQNFSAVVMQLVSGTGSPLSGVPIQVTQAMYGWQPPCKGPGRCGAPPLLGTSVSTYTTNASGQVSIPVLTQSNTAEQTNIVATAGTAAMAELSVAKAP